VMPGFWGRLVSLIFFAGLALDACKSTKDYPGPPDYDFSHPVIVHLPSALDEISGIVFHPKDTSLFAIQDEKGWLFKIYLRTPVKIEKWKFSNSGDYEDLSLVDSTFYVLKSKGAIEEFRYYSFDSSDLRSFKVPSEDRNEYETLYYDSQLKKLVVVCKDCAQDKKGEISTWTFDPATQAYDTGWKIQTDKIRQSLKENKKIKPSAAAISPMTGELYILASINKALIILNKDRSFKAAYKISPTLFPQPEGICFTAAGDLIISNEAADKEQADLLIYKFHKS
ncbi:MAG TPA: SdiA-regulated domain-containing protein, partial [Chitinophagaceae bacterium]